MYKVNNPQTLMRLSVLATPENHYSPGHPMSNLVLLEKEMPELEKLATNQLKKIGSREWTWSPLTLKTKDGYGIILRSYMLVGVQAHPTIRSMFARWSCKHLLWGKSKILKKIIILICFNIPFQWITVFWIKTTNRSDYQSIWKFFICSCR